jgi:hypothetical protein
MGLEIVAQGTTSPSRLEVEYKTMAWDLMSRPMHQKVKASKEIYSAKTGRIPHSQRKESFKGISA